MPRNIEAKYRNALLPEVAERARAVGATDSGVLIQTDTFFNATAGRLKLREQAGESDGQLIGYRRVDNPEARASDYLIYRTAVPGELSEALAHALGVMAVVRKRRHLFTWRHTRIHLDEVDSLGSFVELETVLHGGLTDSDARAELAHVESALGLSKDDIVAEAYVDLQERLQPK